MIYQLAENLHCTVTYLKGLPASELNGWFQFYEEKDRREQVKKGNLLAMDDEEIVGSLRSMGVLEE